MSENSPLAHGIRQSMYGTCRLEYIGIFCLRLKLKFFVNFYFNRTKGAIALINAHEGSISSCFIANNGESLVSAGYDRIIVLWDLVHGVPKLTLRVNNNQFFRFNL